MEAFAAIYIDVKGTQNQLHAVLEPVMERYGAAPLEEQLDFRGNLVDFVRLYAFLSQVMPFADPELEKLYTFARLLLRKLPANREELPLEIRQQIDLDSYRVQRTGSGSISLKRGNGNLDPMAAKDDAHVLLPDEVEMLSAIIQELNEHFGTDFSEEDRVFIEQLEACLAENTALNASARVNPPENARLTFNHVVSDTLQEMIDSNFKFYKQITDDAEFAGFLIDWLFQRYLKTKSGT